MRMLPAPRACFPEAGSMAPRPMRRELPTLRRGGVSPGAGRHRESAPVGPADRGGGGVAPALGRAGWHDRTRATTRWPGWRPRTPTRSPRPARIPSGFGRRTTAGCGRFATTAGPRSWPYTVAGRVGHAHGAGASPAGLRLADRHGPGGGVGGQGGVRRADGDPVFGGRHGRRRRGPSRPSGPRVHAAPGVVRDAVLPDQRARAWRRSPARGRRAARSSGRSSNWRP